jgi:hypothetical protein
MHVQSGRSESVLATARSEVDAQVTGHRAVDEVPLDDVTLVAERDHEVVEAVVL